ncbi:hypothetical protein FACS1894172_20660 [Spirochaetia bacterium]|nr:hypothetical protein FACS1894164_12430 [Spirochaetia bacterium]GHU37295.1 hypothetical protein FACS1894172_20660 [Spirochaetia bacterium]
MIQIYLLSVVLNGAAAFLIITDTAYMNDSLALILGILAVMTGILKLLLPMDIPVIGDLIPALAGLIAGLLLFFEYRQAQSDLSPGGFESFFMNNKKWFGIIVAGAAVLHFLLPQALLL